MSASNQFDGFTHGIGIGGWLTNYKRLAFIPEEWQGVVTVGDREHFESYITENDIRQIASWGVDHIRLAFNYEVIEEDRNPFVYKEEGAQYLDRAIRWCQKYHLNILLDLHMAAGSSCDCNYKRHLVQDPLLRKRFIGLWRFLSMRYRSEGQDVAFELLNEIHVPGQELWNTLVAEAVREIRQISADRRIVAGCNDYGDPAMLPHLALLEDPGVIYTFHFYKPFEFTHQRRITNARLAVYNRNLSYPSDIAPYNEYWQLFGEESPYKGLTRMDRHFMENELAPAFEFQEKHPDKILYCGEFGVIRHCDMKSRENFFRDLISLLEGHHIAHCAWNYLSMPQDENRFSIVDDWNRKPLSDELIRIIR